MALLTSTSQCTRVKKNGSPCTRHAMKWSEFCWQHSPREVWIPSVACMVVGVILGLLISVAASEVSQLAGQRTVNLERGRTIPMIGRFPFILSNGGGYQIVAGPGYYPPGVEGRPFSVMVGPDRTIRVYGEIRGQSGIIFVQAEGEFVRALPGGGYDINSDRTAIEVVDEKQMPVFQLRIRSHTEWNKSLRETEDRVLGEVTGTRTRDERREMLLSMLRQHPPIQPQADQTLLSRESAQMHERHESLLKQAQDVLELNYVTATNGTWIVATPQGSRGHLDLQEVESLRVHIERIFEYPGHKYPGKRVLESSTRE